METFIHFTITISVSPKVWKSDLLPCLNLRIRKHEQEATPQNRQRENNDKIKSENILVEMPGGNHHIFPFTFFSLSFIEHFYVAM